MKLKIAPSILSADFSCLGDQVRAVDRAGADLIHVDVMDGHFVPNLSMGPMVVSSLKKVTSLPLDVHLMLSQPDRFIENFVEAGASSISFHIEAAVDHRAMFRWLEEKGVGRGIVLNPATSEKAVLELLPLVDMVLVMTVHPGFGAQPFLRDNLEKIRSLRKAEADLRERNLLGRSLDIQVDGGINRQTAIEARDAGANVFVAGNTIFGAADPGHAVAELRRAVNHQ